ncbi:ABC transporter permease subunit [Bengtsoniella intestinalis]|uniref:ABC transporter permease n=1 Tax=Bengtsoniella intestinalis TaxID=3073143 RepID=UPI00391F7A3F
MIRKDQALGHSLLVLLFVLVLLPLLFVLAQIVSPGLTWEAFDLGNLSAIFGIFEKKAWMSALTNSIQLGSGTTIFALALSIFLAHIRVSYQFPLAKAIDVTAWILLIVPSFILAQGWIYFGSGAGIAAVWLGISGLNTYLYSVNGLITIMVLCKFPLAYITVKGAMEWYPDSLVHAARMNGANPVQVWTKVRLPLCLPAFFSGAMLVFMDTIGDWGMSSAITAAFPFSTLPYAIYSAICTTPVRFDTAGVLSLYLIGLIFIAMIIQHFALGRRRFDFVGTGATAVVAQKIGKVQTALLTGFTLVFCTVTLGIPIGSNIIMSFTNSFSIQRFSFTLDNYIAVLSDQKSLLSGLQNSLSIAAGAAIFGLIAGFAVAYTLTYSRYKLKKAIDSITLIAMAVPGVILGIGYIFVWNQSWLTPLGLNLYGKSSILILASVAVAIPLTNRLMVAGMAKVPQDLLVAAQVQGLVLAHG